MTPEEYLAKYLSLKVDTIYNNPNATVTIAEVLPIMRKYAEDYYRQRIKNDEENNPPRIKNEKMMEGVNVWIFEETDEILVTDQTGGVPVGANQLFDFHGPNAWSDAVKKASEIKGQRGIHWTIEYDSWPGRDMAEQADEIL